MPLILGCVAALVVIAFLGWLLLRPRLGLRRRFLEHFKVTLDQIRALPEFRENRKINR